MLKHHLAITKTYLIAIEPKITIFLTTSPVKIPVNDSQSIDCSKETIALRLKGKRVIANDDILGDSTYFEG